MSELSNSPLSGSGLPTWEVIADIRGTLGRIETKVDFVLTQMPLLDAKVAAMDAKQYALEQGRIANRADIEANRAEITLLRQTLDAYDLPPSHFRVWKTKVDEAVAGFNGTQFAGQVRQQMRKQDVALLAGIGGVVGFILGSAPVVLDYLRGF